MVGIRHGWKAISSEGGPAGRRYTSEGRRRGGSAVVEEVAMDNETGTLRVKTGLAEMLKGGVIMDVTTADQAKIAEDAGACAVMALERVPADIRAEGGVGHPGDPAFGSDVGRHALQ